MSVKYDDRLTITEEHFREIESLVISTFRDLSWDLNLVIEPPQTFREYLDLCVARGHSEERARWSIFNRIPAALLNKLCKGIYEYANDNNINSALRLIIR